MKCERHQLNVVNSLVKLFISFSNFKSYFFTYFSGCDACEDWYHGDCIGITRKQSKLIKHYFCDV